MLILLKSLDYLFIGKQTLHLVIWTKRLNFKNFIEDAFFMWHHCYNIKKSCIRTCCVRELLFVYNVTFFVYHVTGRLSTLSMSITWIGAKDDVIEGGWYWIDNAPFAYENWRPGKAQCPLVLKQNAMILLTLFFSIPRMIWYFACKLKRAQTTPVPKPNKDLVICIPKRFAAKRALGIGFEP